VVYDLLFKASSEAVLTIAADPEHLGARIGITAVLHTWGSTMTHHPYVHMIVPGGGIALDGKRWLSCQPRFLLPVPVLTKLFQGLMLAKLLAAHKAGRLTFFGQHVPTSRSARPPWRPIAAEDNPRPPALDGTWRRYAASWSFLFFLGFLRGITVRAAGEETGESHQHGQSSRQQHSGHAGNGGEL
jgi:hypothetical protein